MRAITYQRYGPVLDVLDLQDVPRPEITSDELLVRVRASAINPGDLFFILGIPLMVRLMTGLRAPRHPVPGLVVAGTVEQVGSGVVGFTVGESVYAEISRGGFAEYARVPARRAARTPGNLTLEQAAAVPLVGATALQALRDVGRVGPGTRLLVNGASGGVGTFAVQVGVALGAEVTGVCGPGNVDLVRSLGATSVIDYTVAEFTDGSRRWDVVMDNVGNRSVSDLRRALAPDGTLIPSANSGGRWIGAARRSAYTLMLSPFVRQRLRPFLATADAADLATLTEMIEAGTITPVIDRSYPLEDTAKALDYYAQGHARGKVVLTVETASS